MELFDFISLLNMTIEKSKEDRLWERWLVEMPHFEKFMSFTDYLKKATEIVKTSKTVTKEEALSIAEKIKMADQKGGN